MANVSTMEINPFMVKAIQSYKGKKGELSFKTDQEILVTQSNVKEFLYYGKLDGKEGWFPYFYVKSIEPGDKKTSTTKPASDKVSNSLKRTSNYFKAKEKMNKEYVLKSGMLGKETDQPKVYKERWIVLRPGKINYYRTAVDKKPIGKLSVKNIRSVNFAEVASKESKLFCFSISTKKKDNVIFAAKTKEDCHEWIKMIHFAMSGGKPQVGERLMMTGSLTKDPRKNNKERRSPRSSLPPSAVLRRQMTLEKIHMKLQQNGTPPTSEIIQKLKALQTSSVDLASTVDIELENIVVPDGNPIGTVRALYDRLGRSEMELTFRKNDEILLIKQMKGDWWLGLLDLREGYFPKDYVTVLELTKSAPTVPESPRKLDTISSPAVSRKKEEKKVSLLENFQIGERIGKGQYGSVFRGINVENGEMVAIKQVGAARLNKKELANIMGELDLLKEMNHPNILSYKGFIRTSEHINIVLDFVEGGSLQSIIGKFGVIPERLAICYIKQILEGLEYLHARSVIHRDIKCGNILVTKDGSVKLADFGIASKLGDPSEVAGSPYWMAPEVIQHISSGPPCDIWALGCTIIELITGIPPYFEQNQMSALFSMVENERPPFPENISEEMDSFLTACFIRDPAARATARQLRRHKLVYTPGEEPELDELDTNFDLQDLNLDGVDLSALEGLEDYGELAALGEQFDYSDPSDLGDLLGDFNLDGLENYGKDIDLKNSESSEFDDENSSGVATSDTDFDEGDLEGLDLDDFELSGDMDNVTEEDLQFLKDDQRTQKLLDLFHDSMDKGNVTHAVRVRKSVRSQLPELKKRMEEDFRYKILVEQVTMSMDRCEDEMGEYIPVDSDEEEE